MIVWKDFLFDEVLGPTLVSQKELMRLGADLQALQDAIDGLNQVQSGRPAVRSVMDDANEALGNASTNQETSKSQLPARMVGETSNKFSENRGKEAEYGDRTALGKEGGA